MQRKDYNMVAQLIREGLDRLEGEPPAYQQAARGTLWRFVSNFTLEAAHENHRFDRDRFVTACGFTPIKSAWPQ